MHTESHCSEKKEKNGVYVLETSLFVENFHIVPVGSCRFLWFGEVLAAVESNPGVLFHADESLRNSKDRQHGWTSTQRFVYPIVDQQGGL